MHVVGKDGGARKGKAIAWKADCRAHQVGALLHLANELLVEKALGAVVQRAVNGHDIALAALQGKMSIQPHSCFGCTHVLWCCDQLIVATLK